MKKLDPAVPVGEVTRRGFLIGAIVLPAGMALPKEAVQELVSKAEAGEHAPIPRPPPALPAMANLHEAFMGRCELVLFNHEGLVLGRFMVTELQQEVDMAEFSYQGIHHEAIRPRRFLAGRRNVTLRMLEVSR